MIVDDLETELPNGLHDIFIVTVKADFENCVCIIAFATDKDEERIREITFKGLSLFIAEPPDSTYSFADMGRIWASGFDTTEKILPQLRLLRERVPKECFFYSFFMERWNSFIHIAATDAALI
jgi:hypothetical protein